MLIGILSPDKDLAVTGQDIIRLFYPEACISFAPEAAPELLLRVSAWQQEGQLMARAEVLDKNNLISEDAFTDTIPAQGDARNIQKRLVKLALFRVLGRLTGIPPGPWGILTGIRPTKIVHRLMDLGWGENRILDYLEASYDMAPAKAGLLTDIAITQRPFLLDAKGAARVVSVYIGIPFCPTRCAYCSFPSYPLDRHQNEVEPFLQALRSEIRMVGEQLSDLGMGIQTIYIGGGTPTVLDGTQLRGLLGTVRQHLVSAETCEVTLEAGRPDTITEDKLAAAREYGVTRLSVNPQTMNYDTLVKIGRCHRPEDIYTSVELARRLGFENLNMDIIIGLPGENMDKISHTLREIRKLEPENLTVHTLAVKRASKIKESKDEYDLPALEETENMLLSTALTADKMGMHAYYLYRQKKMVGPLENIGYARPGFDCIYNIQMIEERQTIIGLGGGAGSKFVEPGTWYLTSHYNPKDPENYIGRVDEMVSLKAKKLRELIGSIR